MLFSIRPHSCTLECMSNISSNNFTNLNSIRFYQNNSKITYLLDRFLLELLRNSVPWYSPKLQPKRLIRRWKKLLLTAFPSSLSDSFSWNHVQSFEDIRVFIYLFTKDGELQIFLKFSSDDRRDCSCVHVKNRNPDENPNDRKSPRGHWWRCTVTIPVL